LKARMLLKFTRHSRSLTGWMVFLLYVYSGYLYIVHFGFELAQYDEFTYAVMAADFARPFVYEPFFYGQDYNFPVEAWIAAPLVATRLVDPLTSVKIAAYTLFLAPFLLAGWIAHNRGQSHVAFAIWILPFLSSIFFIISPMPRGFINGTATAALAAMLFISRPKAPLIEKTFYFCFLAIAFHVNPSASLVVVPVLMLALSKALRYPFRKALQQVLTLWSAFSIVVLALFAWRSTYFRRHPTFNYFSIGESAGSLIDFHGFSLRLAHYPFLLKGYETYLVCIIALTCWGGARLLASRQYRWLSTVVAGLSFIVALVLAALAGKVDVDRGSAAAQLVGLHPGRLFTGIPYFLAIVLLQYSLEARRSTAWSDFSRRHLAVLSGVFFCAAIILSIFHLDYFAPNYNSKLPQGPGGLPVRNTVERCRKLESSAREPEKTLVVTYSPEIAYLCEATSKVGLHTFHVYERRNYRLQDMADGKFQALLVVNIPALCGQPIRRLSGGSDNACCIDVVGAGNLNDWLLSHGVPVREGKIDKLPRPSN
jgi:hypothetical protein